MATRIVAPILLVSAVICTIPIVSRGAGNEGKPAPSKTVDMKTEFERLYLESEKTPSLLSNRDMVISGNPGYMKMIALGPRCLPFLMAKVDQGVPSRYNLIGVAEKILKVRPPRDPKIAIKGGEQRWLKRKLEKGHQEAKARFTKLQVEWAAAKAQSKDHVLWKDITVLDKETKVLKVRREHTPMGKVYRDIQSLGLFVLPSLMEGLAAGRHTDFLPIVRFLTNGRAPIHGASPAVETKRCNEWWKKHEAEWIVPVFEK
jgi:hypothetical protein